MRIAQEAERIGRVEGVGRALEASPAALDPELSVSHERANAAARPGRVALKPHAAYRQAERLDLGLLGQRRVELPDEGVVDSEDEARHAQPVRLAGALEERDRLGRVRRHLVRPAPPDAVLGEDVLGLAHGRLVPRLPRGLERLAGVRLGALAVADEAPDEPGLEVKETREARVRHSVEPLLVPSEKIEDLAE